MSVIAGACPMMYGPGADFGHTCMRWILGLRMASRSKRAAHERTCRAGRHAAGRPCGGR
jgi:hypothetical protein